MRKAWRGARSKLKQEGFKEMKNAFSRLGRTCARLGVAGGLLAGALLAGSPNPVTVTLPHAVTVGSTTLPSGQYTISSVNMGDGGDSYFIVRSANSPVVALPALKIDAPDQGKTEVVFTKDGDTWRFNKMFIEGEDIGYEFLNLK
jgi:hypothetical protein